MGVQDKYSAFGNKHVFESVWGQDFNVQNKSPKIISILSATFCCFATDD